MSSTPKKISSGSVSSPANTPEAQQKTLGGMPPTKTETQINDVNSPKKAPDTQRGL